METRSEYIGTYSVPNGYFGDRSIVHAVFYNGKILFVTKTGWFTDGYINKVYANVTEAKWYIENHYRGEKYIKAIA